MIEWFAIEDPARCCVLYFTPDAPVRVREDNRREIVVVETNDECSIDWTPVAIAESVQSGKGIANTMIKLGAFAL
jgi:hypothetical protein